MLVAQWVGAGCSLPRTGAQGLAWAKVRMLALMTLCFQRLQHQPCPWYMGA